MLYRQLNDYMILNRRRKSYYCWPKLTFWSPVWRKDFFPFTKSNSVKTYEWLTRGWFCGWCPVWRGRVRGRPAGWAGCRSGPAESPRHPHPAAAAMWGESGCPRTGSEHPEDPSPLALQAHTGASSSCAASRGEAERKITQIHISQSVLLLSETGT